MAVSAAIGPGSKVVPGAGFGPAFPACKAGVLPLRRSWEHVVEVARIELAARGPKSEAGHQTLPPHIP